MITLAIQDILKEKFAVEPSVMQRTTTFIYLPFSLKVIFGFLTDYMPILGSRKKAYLRLWSIMQILVMGTVFFFPWHSYWMTTICCFSGILSVAFSDVVLDGIVVDQARKDPAEGAIWLQSYNWYF
jgi:hypothetical protein